jgi:hypothetical protein
MQRRIGSQDSPRGQAHWATARDHQKREDNMHRSILSTTLLLALAAACEPGGSEKFDAPFGVAASELTAQNGLSLNGLSANGLSANGLSANGLSANGLSSATLGTTKFRDWFNRDVALADMAMRYLVHCAAPSTKTISWKNSVTGITHSWPGGIGVAPKYAGGTPPTLDEQQLITGCVLAHVNKFGRKVSIAVEGRTATGAEIPWTQAEISTYANIEGAYFGNMFVSGGGLYACNDKMDQVPRSYSSYRVCNFNYWPAQAGDGCDPIVQLGVCSFKCNMDTTNWIAFKDCTWNGTTYKPVTVLVQHSDWYQCGDGVCQPTEKCGTGTAFDNCKDCGPCP